jgi:hypothetical protein
MKRTVSCLLFPSVLVGCMFSVVWGQAGGDDRRAEAADTPPESSALEEEMRVLATIVHENVQAAYQFSNEAEAAAILPPLAERLQGYGIVMQMRVPPIAPGGPPPGTELTVPLSRWESTRLRLRGVDTVAQHWLNRNCRQCHDVNASLRASWYLAANNWMQQTHPYGTRRPLRSEVIDAVINALLENGHHLSQLTVQQRLTVSLSFPPPESADGLEGAESLYAGGGEGASGDNLASAEPQPSTASEDYLQQLRRIHLDLYGTIPSDDLLRNELQGTYDRLSNRLLYHKLPATPVAGQVSGWTRVRISVRKSDLDDAAAGRLTREELRKRVEIRE